MDADDTRLIRHIVDKCPHCGKRHDYAVKLRQAPMVFGGASGQKLSATVVPCPDTGMPIETNVAISTGEVFVDILLWPHAKRANRQDRDDTAPIGDADAAESMPVNPVPDEYVDWVKASRATGLEFGKNMLTTSSGAVAVYFAVLKYLGFEKAPNSLSAFFCTVPPVLFTCATAAFALALRPALARVDSDSFSSWRDTRLIRINRFLNAGAVLLVLGLALAVWVYVNLIMMKSP
jgi:hypothetical protein